jgi:hypothetical protein
MPNRHASKKGRLSGEARKAINAKTIESVFDAEDVVFGRMSKHYGNGRVEVVIEDERDGEKTGGKKIVQAHIRRVLCKRGATPITSSDIVGLTTREYEKGGDSSKTNYDLICVFDRKSVSSLEKEGKIPKWMTVVGDCKSAETKDFTEMFEFDYTAERKESDDKGALGGAGIVRDEFEVDIDISKI